MFTPLFDEQTGPLSEFSWLLDHLLPKMAATFLLHLLLLFYFHHVVVRVAVDQL
jgi:hypothetical protein